MKYGLDIENVKSYKFNSLVQGLMFDDKTPFGYIIMVRNYKGEFRKANPTYHRQLMKDKYRFAIKLTEKEQAQSLQDFWNIAKQFEKKETK